MVAFAETREADESQVGMRRTSSVILETYKLISYIFGFKLAWLAHFLQSPELWFRFAQAKTALPLHLPEHSKFYALQCFFTWLSTEHPIPRKILTRQDFSMNVWNVLNAPSSGSGTPNQHFRASAKAEPRSPYRSDPAIPAVTPTQL